MFRHSSASHTNTQRQWSLQSNMLPCAVINSYIGFRVRSIWVQISELHDNLWSQEATMIYTSLFPTRASWEKLSKHRNQTKGNKNVNLMTTKAVWKMQDSISSQVGLVTHYPIRQELEGKSCSEEAALVKTWLWTGRGCGCFLDTKIKKKNEREGARELLCILAPKTPRRRIRKACG